MEKKLTISLTLLLLSIFLSFTISTVFNYPLFNYSTYLCVLSSFAILISCLKLNSKKLFVCILFSVTLCVCWLINQINEVPNSEGILNLLGTVLMLGFLVLIFKGKRANLKMIDSIVQTTIIVVIIMSLLNYFDIYHINLETTQAGFSWIFLNPNAYAMFLFFLLSYSTIFLENNNKKYLMIFLLFLLEIMTVSRGAITSALILLLGYFCLYRREIFSFIRVSIVVITSILISTMINFEYFIKYINVKNEGGDSGRTEIWNYVLQNYILDSPLTLLFGNGIWFASIKEFNNLSPHNSYLFFLGKYGLVSFIILIYYLYLNVKRMGIKSIGTFFIISIIFYSMFESSFFTGLNGIWIGTIFIILMYNMRFENSKMNQE